MKPAVHINCLPSELLSLIFITVVNDGLSSLDLWDEPYVTTGYSTQLASVCAYWRHIALSTPTLWTHVDLTHNRDLTRTCKYAELYFQRSAHLQLYVHLGKFSTKHTAYRVPPDSPGPYWEAESDLPEPITSLLIAHAPRIRSFRLNAHDDAVVVAALLALISNAAGHSLDDLTMRLGCNGTLLEYQQMQALFKGLRALYLEQSCPDLASIPCHNLVELHLVNISTISSTKSLAHLLNSNHNLRIVRLRRFYHDTPKVSLTQTINLPNIRTLDLDQLAASTIKWLLNVMVPGPHSLDLRLYCMDSGTVEDVTLRDAMITFFQKAPVVSLTLSVECFPLTPILAFLPHLRHLGLYEFDLSLATFDRIEQVTNTLSHLHTIDLNDCIFDDYTKLYPGLRILLTLPSVQRIRYLECRYTSGNRFLELLSDETITAQPTECPGLNRLVYSSPYWDWNPENAW
ncbi:hypothetical protein FS749_001604 [Ceratobasidium sp. UAMH 11750]|nr:hypothetical protein FS749_001604 [Ceratobasidium sp. UAMH 11750]